MSTDAMTGADSSDLEDLFDTIVAQRETEAAPLPASLPAVVPMSAPQVEERAGAASSADKVINSVGHLTRQLHDTLAELGYDRQLQECAAATLPDARQRLAYVVKMCEQAASRCLNAVDAATPVQEGMAKDANDLAKRWDAVFEGEADVEAFKRTAADTREYLRTVENRTEETRGYLQEVVMAQEFQDLTGQVLKRITDLANDLERQLLTLLVENAPSAISRPEALSLLNGPAVGAPSADVMANQGQVDELLESLGF